MYLVLVSGLYWVYGLSGVDMESLHDPGVDHWIIHDLVYMDFGPVLCVGMNSFYSGLT